MCPEKTCHRDSFGEVRGVAEGSFRGGRKPFLKPSAFESEIHPPHKPSVYATGYFALPGANSRRREFIQSERAGLYLSMPHKRRAHGWHCYSRLHFVVDMQHRLWDFTERSPFAAVRERQP